jgi:hypothetical protein
VAPKWTVGDEYPKLREVCEFFVAHHGCQDRHIVTKQKRLSEDLVRVTAMCPGCGGSVVADLSDEEIALLRTLPGRQRSALN